jgi:hypothetical protein
MSWDETDQKIYQACERKGLEIVRHGAEPPAKRAPLLFRVIVEPSFTAVRSWDVFQIYLEQEKSSFLAVCTRWRRDIDLERAFTPIERLRYRTNSGEGLQPLMETHNVPLEATDIERLLNRFGSVNLALAHLVQPLTSLGLDGTKYRVVIGNSMSKLDVSWWESGPVGWRSLVETTNDFLKLVSDLEPG